MEEGGADIVDVPLEREHASLLLEVPHLDHAVVAARHEQRQLRVEVHASDRPLVSLHH